MFLNQAGVAEHNEKGKFERDKNWWQTKVEVLDIGGSLIWTSNFEVVGGVVKSGVDMKEVKDGLSTDAPVSRKLYSVNIGWNISSFAGQWKFFDW